MSKYFAKKVTTPEGVFDSRKEYKRFLELRVLQQAGEITNLERQVEFELIPAQKGKARTERPVKYKADFVYWKGEELIVEDVKSNYTRKLPEYIIKRKLMLYQKGIEVKEIL